MNNRPGRRLVYKKFIMVPALTEKSLMLFGSFQGHELGNIPPSYLLWIYDNLTLRDDLKAYIEKRKSHLIAEKKRADREKYK